MTCPLNKHLKAGTIKLDGTEYYGIRPDGREVWLGAKGDESGLRRYLKDAPTHEYW